MESRVALLGAEFNCNPLKYVKPGSLRITTSAPLACLRFFILIVPTHPPYSSFRWLRRVFVRREAHGSLLIREKDSRVLFGFLAEQGRHRGGFRWHKGLWFLYFSVVANFEYLWCSIMRIKIFPFITTRKDIYPFFFHIETDLYIPSWQVHKLVWVTFHFSITTMTQPFPFTIPPLFSNVKLVVTPTAMYVPPLVFQKPTCSRSWKRGGGPCFKQVCFW